MDLDGCTDTAKSSCLSWDTEEAVGPLINGAHKHAILGEPEK